MLFETPVAGVPLRMRLVFRRGLKRLYLVQVVLDIAPPPFRTLRDGALRCAAPIGAIRLQPLFLMKYRMGFRYHDVRDWTRKSFARGRIVPMRL